MLPRPISTYRWTTVKLANNENVTSRRTQHCKELSHDALTMNAAWTAWDHVRQQAAEVTSTRLWICFGDFSLCAFGIRAPPCMWHCGRSNIDHLLAGAARVIETLGSICIWDRECAQLPWD